MGDGIERLFRYELARDRRRGDRASLGGIICMHDTDVHFLPANGARSSVVMHTAMPYDEATPGRHPILILAMPTTMRR